MHRIDTANAVADLFGAGKKGFGPGNPATNTPATFLDDDWCNAIQEELAAIVEAKFALNPADRGQVLKALQSMFMRNEQVIDRTGEASTILLDRFDVVHKYRCDRSNTASGTLPFINATTGMVPGAVYKVWCNSANAGSFRDIIVTLRPNNTTYANQFVCNYINFADGVSQANRVSAVNLPHFQFDNLGGFDGTEGCFEMTIFSQAQSNYYKKVIYQGGDVVSACSGVGVWLNTTVQWSTIGRFTFSDIVDASNPGGAFFIDLYVRRVA